MIRSYNSYPKNNDMDQFLSDTMRIINVFNNKHNLNKADIKFKDSIINSNESLINTNIFELDKKFEIAMNRAYEFFGEHSFRKSYIGKKRTPINKGLFEVWCNIFSNMSNYEFERLSKKKESFMKDYIDLLNDDNFIIVISRDSQKFSSVKTRYEKINNLIEKFVND